MRIEDTAIVVTGGGSGLGEMTARHLAGLGGKVAVIDLSADRAAQVGKEIGGIGLAADVSDAAALEGALGDIAAAQGPCRVLVNCAGIGTSQKILDRERNPMPLEDFGKVLSVNLLGSFNALRLAASQMAAQAALEDGERGVIVNTASIAAFEGQIGQIAYAASKGGVHAMTLPAARELARHGIRVNTIAPGVFRTPMFETVKPEWRQGIIDAVPFPKRCGEPDEFAELIAFLIRSPMANGATYRLDGALRLG